MDDIRTFGSAEASGRVETIDWDKEIRRKRASEGSGVPVGAGASDGSIFRTTLGTTGTGLLNVFGTFGRAGASGRVGTIDGDRGTRRKRASGSSGAPVRMAIWTKRPFRSFPRPEAPTGNLCIYIYIYTH